jgi:hypothetical protein
VGLINQGEHDHDVDAYASRLPASTTDTIRRLSRAWRLQRPRLSLRSVIWPECGA